MFVCAQSLPIRNPLDECRIPHKMRIYVRACMCTHPPQASTSSLSSPCVLWATVILKLPPFRWPPSKCTTTLQLQTLSNPLPQANFQSHVPWKVWVSRGSPGSTVVKNLPTQEPQGKRVGTQDWEDPLEGEIATHSSALAWRIPWTEKPGGLQSMGLQRVRQDRATERECTHVFLSHVTRAELCCLLFLIVSLTKLLSFVPASINPVSFLLCDSG